MNAKFVFGNNGELFSPGFLFRGGCRSALAALCRSRPTLGRSHTAGQRVGFVSVYQERGREAQSNRTVPPPQTPQSQAGKPPPHSQSASHSILYSQGQCLKG